ncbi:MAG: aldo/keto reductase [Candidatus Phocaeicola excrementipullorum]|uniref:Aldo/keto reductase n=1 Tax=Candidatus Phocaeicola excrementipullorum TaxID=2838731 RepID=A0A948X3X1_9BACT|nr:aldo/keto reductase [Candidatus Phocaeicola excrementipullorum]
MEYAALNNGVRMPMLGFGVYQVDDHEVCRRCVSDAIATGYRLLDMASVYLNEEAVGRAVKESGVPRGDFFLTSKVWIQDMGYEQTLRAFDRTLARLGTDYLDLYLVHMPFGDVFGAWRAMERIYREGRTRAVGVCNFNIPRLADLAAHFEVVPAVNQVETHLFSQQRPMKRYADVNGILLEAWSPFAEGRNGFFNHAVLSRLARKYGKTVAQIELGWLMQRGIAVIPKSVHRERIEENFGSIGFRLSDEDMATVAACDTGKPVVGDFDDPAFVKDLCGRKYDI